MMTFIYFLAITLFLLLCVVLCGTILIQESKSSGFGASFGGEAGDSLFGTATADVLKRFTAWLAVIFIASCVILSLWTSSMARSKSMASSEGPYPSELMNPQ
ncbi:MAG: preprotein translocase subunit SecG [Parachlamydiaceae bacterium]